MPSDEHGAPQRTGSKQTASQQTTSGPLPLGRTASRVLVIGSILFVLAASIGGSWLILHLARSGTPPQEAVPADSTGAPARGDTAAAVP